MQIWTKRSNFGHRVGDWLSTPYARTHIGAQRHRGVQMTTAATSAKTAKPLTSPPMPLPSPYPIPKPTYFLYYYLCTSIHLIVVVGTLVSNI